IAVIHYLTMDLKIKDYSSKAENLLETISQPLKSHIPIISRFLIVATFLEDTLRILFQWNSQAAYLERLGHVPQASTHIFLFSTVVVSFNSFLYLKKKIFFF